MADTTYHVGEEVRHARFGVGVVTKGGSGRVEIRFEGHGTKQFVPEIAPLAKTGKANPEFASSRNNGNTDDIEAYRGGALHASPSEEVRERIQTFIGLGDKQGWSPYDDTDDEDYDYAWTPELLAIKAEYEQEEALAGLFAAIAAKTDIATPSALKATLIGTRTGRRGSSSRKYSRS